MLSDNLSRVRQRISQACQRSGRDPSSVTLVCVTKGVALEAIRQVVDLGITDVGENRIQEARTKIPALARAGVQWHLIGHLQRNKAKEAVELFDMIHSVDSLSLAEELERQAAKRAHTKEVLIQVNVSGEATKFGCRAEEALGFARAVSRLDHLRLRGLMTIPPLTDDPEAARPHFHRLRQLRDEVATALSLEPTALSLSMGMSSDFEVAIEEGADLVRIGTAIFGDQRPETRDQRLEKENGKDD